MALRLSARGWSLLITAAVPLAAMALNVQLLASEPFLRWEYARPGFPEAPGFSAAERLAAAVPSTRFIVRSGPPSALARLSVAGRSLYTAEEIAHLVDVRRVVTRLTAVGLLAALALAAGLVAAGRGQRDPIGTGLVRGGGLTVALVVLVGVGIGVAWPWVFTGFHQVFFPPGTWQFADDSGLIRLFPGRFWYDTALALATLCAVEGLLAVAVGWWLRRGGRREGVT